MAQKVTFFQLARKSFALLFGGIFLVCGSPFLLAGALLLIREFQFEKQAEVVQGMVLSKNVHRSSKSGTSYSISYRFVTPQGQTLKGTGKVGDEIWDSLEERGPVQILYLPDKPFSNRVRGQTDWFGLLFFMPFGSIFVLIGGFVFFFGLRNCLRQLRLAHVGLSVEGTVTAVEESQVTVNDQPQWVIRYRYYDHQGHPRQGRSEYLSAEEAAAWKVGDTGRVSFNPQRPKESTWAGRTESG